MGKIDEFIEDCKRELDRHEYRLKTEEHYVWEYLASWFKECNWPEGTSDWEKLRTLEYLFHTVPETGHRMAIEEAIRRIRARMGAGKQPAVCVIPLWTENEIDDFTAAVNALSQKYCYMC